VNFANEETSASLSVLRSKNPHILIDKVNPSMHSYAM